MSIVIRGDTHYWEIPITARGGGAYPLAGCTVWVTVKENAGVDDVVARYQHYITFDVAGAVVASRTKGMQPGSGGAASGVVVQKLSPAESKNLVEGTNFYDVQIMLANGDIHTPIKDMTEIVELDYTRATTIPDAIV